MTAAKLKPKKKTEQDSVIDGTSETMEIEESEKHEIKGDIVTTQTVARGNESTIHTAMEHLLIDNMVCCFCEY